MSEPTRGPWRVIHPILEGGSLNVVQSRHTVTKQKVIARMEDQSRRADTEANARLVASAPELLATLSDLIAVVETYEDAWNPETDLWDVRRLASEAERRARGMEQA